MYLPIWAIWLAFFIVLGFVNTAYKEGYKKGKEDK